MLLSLKNHIYLFLLFICVNAIAFSQNLNCPSPYLYAMGIGNILIYDPGQPLSSTNPSNISIPAPAGGLQQQSIAFMPNINGGTLSPTFYALANSQYYSYWNGSTWVNTGHLSGTGLLGNSEYQGLAGCGKRLYELSVSSILTNTATIYVYNGTGSATALTTLTVGVSVQDIASDCNCNIYLLDNGTPQNLRMYDSNGNLVCSYPLTSPIPTYTFGFGNNMNGGLAIVGNTVYIRTNINSSSTSGYFYAGLLGGSSITFTAISTPSSSPNFPAVLDFASCAACGTGSVDVAVSSGTVNCYTPTATISASVITALSPITYSWTGAGIVGTTTNSAASVTVSGTYTCAIHAGGCSPLQPPTQTIVTVAVTSNTVPTVASISPTANICPLPSAQLFSFPNTSLHASSWSGPGIISGSSSPTLTLNTGGNYSVIVTNTLNGCFGAASVTVLPAPILSLSLSSNTLCAQNFNGSINSITLTAGGALNYTLLTSPNFSTSTPNATIISITPSSPYSSLISIATASLIGFDGACTNTITSTFSILPNPFLSTNPSNSTICFGKSMTLSVSGAASYTWSPTIGLNNSNATSVIANPLSSTIYSIIGSNAGCQSSTQSVSLTVLPLPIINLSPVNPALCLNTTSVTLSAAGTGTSFTWSPMQDLSSSYGQTVLAYPAITKTYTVLASLNGCTTIAVTTITVVPPPILNISLSSNSMCAQALSGSPNTITLTSAGATNYTLSTPNHIANSNQGGPSSSLSSLPPFNSGVSTATIQGSNGVCTVSTTVNFSVIPNPTVTISSPTPVICAGQSFTYTNQGATSYTWSNTTPGLTTYSTGQVAVANPSINSVFSVYGGSLGCNSALKTTTITVNPLPVFSLSPGTATVCLNSKITLTAFGDPTSYTWSPYIGLNSNLGSTVSAFPTSLQTYTALGSLNSCTSTALITVSVLSLPSPTAIALKPELCLNELITLQGYGGESYRWDGPIGLMYAGQTVTFVARSRTFSGTYILTVTDVNGCVASNQVGVKINPLPNADLSISKQNGCVPFTSKFSMYTQSVNDSNITAYWQLDNQTFYGKQFSYLFSSAKTYSIFGYYSDTLTTCKNSATSVVEGYPLPKANFMVEPEKPVEGLDEVYFMNTSSGDELKKFNWYFINNQGYQSENKNTSYLFNESGEYPVAMVVQNKWGCADTIVKSIQVEADFNVYVPNAFTPNEDNLNDVFLPILRGVKLYELMIFDRWGKRIFFSTQIQSGWDGYYNGGPAKNDVYTWKISLSTNSGEAKVYTGQVLLSR